MARKIFYKISWITTLFILLVILAGSIVRSTGSGMGCPDWPKCFDQWVPPTHVDQLPTNYRDIFLEKRLSKLKKYTGFLKNLGMSEVAVQLENDPRMVEEEPFVARKTWIEYINRLLGFLAGNFMIIMVILSLFLWKESKLPFFLSFLILVLTSIQGWFGSIVVTSNLTPWTITIHMFLALLILFLLIYLSSKSSDAKVEISSRVKLTLMLALILSLIQIYMGTQVRQEIDVLKESTFAQSDWVSQLTHIFEFHRSFAILVLVVNGYLFLKMKNYFSIILWSIVAVLFFEIISGIVMAYFAVPRSMQPVHLISACLLFSLQSYLIFKTRGNAQIST